MAAQHSEHSSMLDAAIIEYEEEGIRNHYMALEREHDRRAKLRYWTGTILSFRPRPTLCRPITHIRGQRERGDEARYSYWKVFVYCKNPIRLSQLRKLFNDKVLWEPTKKAAMSSYLWEKDTAVAGTDFEEGTPAPDSQSASSDQPAPNLQSAPNDQLAPNSQKTHDWKRIWEHAENGELDKIDPEIRVKHIKQLIIIHNRARAERENDGHSTVTASPRTPI
ncbi:hypothetical protein THASP1DRAFT_31536 [Thamnocephalis sphaerospora]|uniref:Uncharacterized protein n=1 Tax=Thamnocephalis sphaerospora TaxID=78915 RepID=A0A4P9XLG2_9FUNG|nr:hypothetical protein THASP1DRAFT_31536 [Thamnocephalis sphaerospora]|eukprot:RKP06655.1 hypothetical protein THASP1DRAFT_31536 [Thamnocephalis sphaerospora]